MGTAVSSYVEPYSSGLQSWSPGWQQMQALKLVTNAGSRALAD